MLAAKALGRSLEAHLTRQNLDPAKKMDRLDELFDRAGEAQRDLRANST